MGEQLTRAFAPLKQFWGGLGAGAKRLVAAAAVVVLLSALAFSIILNTEKYETIFEDLPQSESSEILAQLYSMGFKAKGDSSGRVMVLEQDVSDARMQLSTAGYPKNGLNYYLLEENNSMLTTDYARKQYANAQMQERIAASIETLDGVREAVVSIAPASENVFYLQDETPPSASVIIHMRPGSTFTSKQIAGIQNLVAKSVNGLSPENIALIDGQGNALAGLGSASDNLMLETTRQFENDLRQKVMSVLVGPYRPEQINVAVSAVLNTDNSVVQEENYFPSPDGDNRGVISYESSSQESYQSTSGDGGVPGTDTNSEVPTYPTGGLGGETQSSSSGGETDYDVSVTKTQTLRDSPRAESVSVSIAIDKESFAPGEEAKIISLASAAAGVAPESVSVQSFPFYKYEEAEAPPGEPEGLNMYLLAGAGAAAAALLALLLLLLLARRKKKAAEAAALAEAEAAAAEQLIEYDEEGMPIAPSAEAEIGPITPMKDKRREEIQQFAKSNPEITAQMIKSLLKAEAEG